MYQKLSHVLLIIVLCLGIGSELMARNTGNDTRTITDDARTKIVADFSADKTSICPQEKITFTDLSFGASSWSWDFGPGALPATATGPGPHEVQYLQAGKKTISLTTDAGNSVKTDYITVNKMPLDLPLRAMRNAVCVGDQAELVLDTSETSVAYQLRDKTAGSNIGSGINGTNGSLSFLSGALASASTFEVYASNGFCFRVLSDFKQITVQNRPLVNSTPKGNIKLCPGDSMPLSASVISNASYNWYAGNQLLISNASASFYPKTAGSYYAKVTNNIGCISISDTTVIAMSVPAQVQITPNSHNGSCVNDSLVFASTGTGITSYQWQFNTQDLSGKTSSVLTVNSSGAYRLLVKNSDNCISTSNSVQTLFSAVPKATIQSVSAPILCIGDSVLVRADRGIDYTYQWILNGVDVLAANADSFYIKTPGDYQLKVDYKGCSNISLTLTIINKPPPSSEIIVVKPSTFCYGDSGLLQAKFTKDLSFLWYRNDTLLIAQNDSLLKVFQTGKYSLKVKSADGCAGLSAPATITARELPIAKILAYPQRIYCTGDSTLLQASTANNYSYQWLFNAAPVSGATSSSLYVSKVGTFSVKVSDSFCSNQSEPVSVIEKDAIAANLVLLGGDNLICIGDSIAMVASSDVPNVNYTWYKDGIEQTATTDSIFYAKSSGGYQVKTSLFSCKTTSSTLPIVNRGISTKPQITGVKTIFCDNDPLTFYAPKQAKRVFEWNYNGIKKNVGVDSILLANPGKLVLSIQDSGLCATKSDTLILTKESRPDPSFTTNGVLPFCFGDSIQADAVSAGLRYQWFRNGLLVSENTVSKFMFKEAGNYQLKVYNANQCSDTSKVFNVNALSNTQIQLKASSRFCTNDSLVLKINPSLNYTISWFKNGQLIPNVTDSLLYTRTSGAFNAVYTNKNNCKVSSDTIEAIQLQNTQPLVTIVGSTPICANDSVRLTTVQAGAYQWYLNNLPITNAISQSYSAKTAGIYKVKAIYGDNCEGISKADTIRSLAKDSLISTTKKSEFCTSDSLQIALKERYAGYQFLWALNGFAIKNDSTSILTIYKGGRYKAIVNNERGCAVSSYELLIKENSLPSAEYSYTGQANKLCVGDTLRLQTTATGTLQWYKDGMPLSNEQGKTLMVSNNGLYQLLVTSSKGCVKFSDSLDLSFSTNKPPIPTIIYQGDSLFSSSLIGNQWYLSTLKLDAEVFNGLRPLKNGEYFVEVSNNEGCKTKSEAFVVSTIGLLKELPKNLLVYPNPVETNLLLEANYGFTFTLYSLDGKLLKKGVHATGLSNLNMIDLPSGTYLLRIQNASLDFSYQILKP